MTALVALVALVALDAFASSAWRLIRIRKHVA